MTQYWCVNFSDDACLNHGIDENLWLMHYQYDDSDSGSRKGRIRLNWERVEEINPGDQFVAYLRVNRFFATGTVITPRRPKTDRDGADTIAKYLKRQKSYHTGFIYFTSVVYENFTDKWSHPSSGDKWPVRIDVESWDNYVQDGIVLPIVNKITLQERQKAVFEITKGDFDRIAKKLAAEHGRIPKQQATGDVEVADDDAVVEALEKSHAKSQGFTLDSKTRKALEDYAMEAATRYFTSLGYAVEDHSKGHPYDLFCTRKKERLHVEVKGTQTNGDGIILTSGEVNFARRNKGQMALFILHSIKVSADGKALSNGQKKVIIPWEVDQGCLKPISFVYDVPSG